VDGPDFGCYNSAYHTVPRLLEELEGQRRFADVPGLIYRENGRVKMTPYEEDPDFELYPHPARHLLPNELYAEFTTERKNFTVMVTSKGCPQGCLFCEAGGTPYNPRSPQTVLNEIEECYTKYHIREIDFFDYEFCINRKRIEALCEGMVAKNGILPGRAEPVLILWMNPCCAKCGRQVAGAFISVLNPACRKYSTG